MCNFTFPVYQSIILLIHTYFESFKSWKDKEMVESSGSENCLWVTLPPWIFVLWRCFWNKDIWHSLLQSLLILYFQCFVLIISHVNLYTGWTEENEQKRESSQEGSSVSCHLFWLCYSIYSMDDIKLRINYKEFQLLQLTNKSWNIHCNSRANIYWDGWWQGDWWQFLHWCSSMLKVLCRIHLYCCISCHNLKWRRTCINCWLIPGLMQYNDIQMRIELKHTTQ